MKELILKITDKLKIDEITSDEAQRQLLCLFDVRQRCKKILAKYSGIHIQYIDDERLDIDFQSFFYSKTGLDGLIDDLNKYIAKLCKDFKINNDLSFTEYESFAIFDDIVEDVFNNVV